MVQFAPPVTDSMSTQQHGVLVSSVDDPDKTFRFKSSWLQRARYVHDGRSYYKTGEFVRLSIKNGDRDETSDKCLGKNAAVGNYGVVKDEGLIRDGIQLNIIVEACVGKHKGEESLYPSFCLNLARRSTVMTERDSELLIEVSQTLFSGYSTAFCQERVSTLGLKVWSFYMILISSGLVTEQLVMAAWKEWNHRREA